MCPPESEVPMSLFAGPVEHAANPPESWRVEKGVTRLWFLKTKDGVTLETFPTKKAAEHAKVESFYVSLYEKESRWYAGEAIPGWKPYAAASA